MCTSIGEGWDNDSIQSINNTIQWGHSTRYRYNKPPWNNGRFRYDISYDITDTDMISVMISQIQIWYQLWYHRYRYDITDTDMISVMILQTQIYRYRYVRCSLIGVLCYIPYWPEGRLYNLIIHMHLSLLPLGVLCLIPCHDVLSCGGFHSLGL